MRHRGRDQCGNHPPGRAIPGESATAQRLLDASENRVVEHLLTGVAQLPGIYGGHKRLGRDRRLAGLAHAHIYQICQVGNSTFAVDCADMRTSEGSGSRLRSIKAATTSAGEALSR